MFFSVSTLLCFSLPRQSFRLLSWLFCLFSAALFLHCDSFAANEVAALKSFKEGIYEDPYSVFSNWNSLDHASPCDWSGISCSPARDHVIKLNISGAALKGFLVPELGQLSSLQELILRQNNLIGTIPKELCLLKNLRTLDLGMNQFSGPIPPEIGNLTLLLKMNLQSNGLTGKLPTEIEKLGNLQELTLDRNKLQGTLPAFNNSDSTSSVHNMNASVKDLIGSCSLYRPKAADFSYNFFVGNIPKCLEYLPRSNFQGNCLQNNDVEQRTAVQCGAVPQAKNHPVTIPRSQPADNVSKHQSNSRPTWLLALEIVTGTMVGSIFLIAMVTALQKCNRKSFPVKKSANENYQVAVYIDSEILKDITKFSRQELEVACEDFSNIIGSSPDSLVYKGTMKGGPEIAVISLCIKEENWTDYLELYYQREVADVARLNHENTGKLLGYCKESTPFTRMLVFEYASNGTLYEHLHYGEGCQLSWTRRMKIIIGVARGLKYLHTEIQPPFTILELNSSTVYLTDDFSPKLLDFENWKAILSRSEKNSGSIDGQGSVCNIPNSLESRHLDFQGNIYAFGILLLEIISGRPAYCKDRGCLIDWAKDYLQLPDIMSYLVDPELKNFRYEDLEVICEVINHCIRPDPAKILLMGELCTTIETRINMSLSAQLKSSSLAWAELALSS